MQPKKIVTYLSEIVLTLGVLAGLYFVWENFYIDFKQGNHQTAIVDNLPWRVPVDQLPPVLTPTGEEIKHTGVSPLVDAGEISETFATLLLPTISPDYEKPIAHGSDKRTILDKIGLGWHTTTQMPGQPGNFVIAGHRTSYGKPLWDIDLLEVGDSVIVRTEEIWFVYKVIEEKIITPAEVEVLAPDLGKEEYRNSDRVFLTLYACHPKFSLRERYVVHAELDYWMYSGDGIPAELETEGVS